MFSSASAWARWSSWAESFARFAGLSFGDASKPFQFVRSWPFNSAVVLGRTQLTGVLRRRVVQYLNLHADVRRVAFEGRTNAEAVVRALLELEFEVHDEIGKFLFREQPSAAAFGAIDHAIFDTVS